MKTRNLIVVVVVVVGVAVAAGLLSRPASVSPPVQVSEPRTHTVVAQPESATPAANPIARIAEPVQRPAPPTSPRAVTPPTRVTTTDHIARVKALDNAFVSVSGREARLYAAFEKAGVQPPRATVDLVAKRRAGASRDDLIQFVMTSFPNDALVRAIAVEWLGPSDQRAEVTDSAVQPHRRPEFERR
jgi:hypothetical protein